MVLAREWELEQSPLLKLEQYQRGFLQAKARISLDPEPDHPSEVIQIQLNIDHGPLLWRPDNLRKGGNYPMLGYAAINGKKVSYSEEASPLRSS